VNDTYTHLVGDQVLKAVAEVLTRSVRENDLAARLAGDEFVILFGDADRDTAVEISNRIKRSVAEFDWNAIAPTLRVTISVGVSTAIEGDTAESLLQRSDKSMYSAKPGWVPTDVSELA
jgi:diguanylate cyclase (GGDEF)-like protein